MKQYNTLSSFWMTDSARETNFKGKDLMKLSQYRRAIANFVNIVTGENIPVKFHTGDDSYTDGKVVTISSNLDDSNFDPVVGLALHEGSHILLTDFDALGFVGSHFPELVDDLQISRPDMGYHEVNEHVREKLSMLLNFVEDRRIDYYVYKNAPGYRGYYDALYKKYFHAKVVDKALKTDNYTTESWESYEFRLINILNKNTHLGALKGLQELWDTLDIKNIGLLKNTKDSLNLAVALYRIIAKHVDQEDTQSKQSKPTSGNSGDDKDFEPTEELTENQEKQLDNAVGKQKDFLDSNIKKSKLSKKDDSKVNAMEASNTTMQEVDYDQGYGGKIKAEVIVIKNLTQQFIETDPYFLFNRYNSNDADYNQEIIYEGVRLGTLLGKKLKITNESRTTNFTRQKRGRIDKRLLSELGCNNSAVFYRSKTDQYKDSFVHISIDGSGSMAGSRFENSMKTAVAIAKAASINDGIDVVISFRYTGNPNRSYNGKEYPIVLIAYDSRKDKFSKITRLFKHIGISGVTPESLCFGAIKDEIINSNSAANKYFINLSDGEPNFCNEERGDRWWYGGPQATKHCRGLIKQFEKEGVNVLSYFVSEWESSITKFKLMYGEKNTALINTYGVTDIARTLNKMFLSSNNKISV